MLWFITRRIFYIILVLFFLSFFLFILLRSMPIDPVDIFLPLEMRLAMEPEQVAIVRQAIIDDMGLEHHTVIQYFYWLRATLQGNLGISMESRLEVMDHIRSPITNTMVINLLAMFVVFAITIPAGIYAAVKRGKTFDNAALVASVFGISVPGFLFALLLIVTLVILLPWDIFPMFGMASLDPPPEGTMDWYMDRLRHMALPLVALVLTGSATMLRIVRSAMIDALHMDCVRTARSKGLREKAVIYSHAFRNALIPIVTIMATFFIGLFGGAIAIEVTFGWQGMGVIMINAINRQDIAVLMSLYLFYAFIAFAVILILDILYVFIDPRIRFQ